LRNVSVPGAMINEIWIEFKKTLERHRATRMLAFGARDRSLITSRAIGPMINTKGRGYDAGGLIQVKNSELCPKEGPPWGVLFLLLTSSFFAHLWLPFVSDSFPYPFSRLCLPWCDSFPFDIYRFAVRGLAARPALDFVINCCFSQLIKCSRLD
jgi:hypothetical protein